MTLTPGAGDYLALFTMDVEFADPAGFEELEVFLKFDGIQNAQTPRFLDSENSLDGSKFAILSSGNTFVTFLGGETIEVFYTASDSAEFVGFNRSLTLFPINTPELASGISTFTTIAGGGEQNFAGVGNNVGPTGGGDYFLLFTTSIDGVADNIVELRVTVDGVLVPHTARRSSNEGSSPDTKMCLMICARVSPLDNQIVRVVWERVAGGGITTAYASRMNLIKTKPGDLFDATSVADDTSSIADVDELIDGMTLSPNCPTEYFALFSSYDFYGSIILRARTTYFITEDNAPMVDGERTFEHENSIDNTPIAIFTGGLVTTPAPLPIESIAADADGSACSASATVHDIPGAAHGVTLSTLLNRYLWVVVSQGNSAEPITSVIWDQGGTNQAMTLVGTVSNGTDARVDVFELLSPVSGQKPIRVTMAIAQGISVGVEGYARVKQRSARNLVTATGTGSPNSGPVSAKLGDLVLDGVASRDTVGPHSPTGGTKRFEASCNTDDDLVLGHHRSSFGGSVTMAWGASVDKEWAQVAAVIEPFSNTDPDITAFWRANTIQLRTMHERALVAIREPAPKQAISATAVGVASMITVFGNITFVALNAVAVGLSVLSFIPFIASLGGRITDIAGRYTRPTDIT
jgi:hypothetical protein